MPYDMRHEKLISQHIDVALVYKEMLGVDDAQAYLNRQNIPRDVAERVLFTEQKRLPRPAQTAPRPASLLPGPPAGCRRKNRIHDAIVEAALKIERTLGPEWALALLRDERVPEAVAERIVAQGPRQVRIKAADGAGVVPGRR